MQLFTVFQSRARFRGFTLLELLTVLSITTILAVLMVSGLQTGFGTAFDTNVAEVASTFVRARAYAIANNTYTFVGLTEVSAATSPASSQTTGNGRIGMVIYATNDGTRAYDPTTSSLPIALPQSIAPFNNATNPTKLVVVAPLRHYDNVHMQALSASSITAFGSTYPITSTSMSPVPYYDLALSTAQAGLTFAWPIGGSQYSFGSTNIGSIVQFNPQGEAQIFTAQYSDAYCQWIQINLVPSHGTSAPATVTNQASIVIDGASGSVGIYRP